MASTVGQKRITFGRNSFVIWLNNTLIDLSEIKAKKFWEKARPNAYMLPVKLFMSIL